MKSGAVLAGRASGAHEAHGVLDDVVGDRDAAHGVLAREHLLAVEDRLEVGLESAVVVLMISRSSSHLG